MFSYPAVSAAHQFQNLARQLGVTIPEPLIEGLAPEKHPRARLLAYTGSAHQGGTTKLAEAIHAALNAGKNPVTDDAVQEAITVQAIWGHVGDLDLAQNNRVAALFRDHWEAIVDAVDAVYAPAAENLTEAHRALSERRLDHADTDGIRRAGGTALAAWAKALDAQNVYAMIPRLMTHANLAAANSLAVTGSRTHWTVAPNLDTWVNEQPDVSDPWAVLASGATLSLARTLHEAEDRTQQVVREHALAQRARRNHGTSGGFGVASSAPVTYTGTDGKERTVSTDNGVRVISTYRNANGYEVQV